MDRRVRGVEWRIGSRRMTDMSVSGGENYGAEEALHAAVAVPAVERQATVVEKYQAQADALARCSAESPFAAIAGKLNGMAIEYRVAIQALAEAVDADHDEAEIAPRAVCESGCYLWVRNRGRSRVLRMSQGGIQVEFLDDPGAPPEWINAASPQTPLVFVK